LSLHGWGHKWAVTVQTRRQFEATPEAVGEARRFLSGVIAGRAGPQESFELALAVSELATIAVMPGPRSRL
jgi:hypothetical protein